MEEINSKTGQIAESDAAKQESDRALRWNQEELARLSSELDDSHRSLARLHEETQRDQSSLSRLEVSLEEATTQRQSAHRALEEREREYRRATESREKETSDEMRLLRQELEGTGVSLAQAQAEAKGMRARIVALEENTALLEDRQHPTPQPV